MIDTRIIGGRVGEPEQAAARYKTFNVPLDPLSSETPQFAQVLVPVPLRDEQKARLVSFIESF